MKSFYRVIDAAANRGREAIRVLEDFVRFICDDKPMTEQLKSLRHRFAAAVKPFSTEDRMTARSTESDVGTDVTAGDEYLRRSVREVIAANFARFQESLRSIEEFSKLVLPSVSAEIEQIRYTSYTLERDVYSLVTRYEQTDRQNKRRRKLAAATLYILLETGVSDETFLALASSGVDIIQLRDKKATDRVIVETGRHWLQILSETRTLESVPLLIMNDRPDLAMAAGFDGVHVGQTEIQARDARAIIGENMLLGLSTGSPEEALAAEKEPIDYIGVGPVFPSTTKSFETWPGPELVAAVMKNRPPFPVYAIGGITTQNLTTLFENSCDRVCIGAAIIATPQPAESARIFKSLLNDHQTEKKVLS